MYHVSFFWQQSVSKTGGWSENFWNNSDSIAVVTTKANDLLSALANAKGNPVFCPRYRISTVGKFRSTTTVLTQRLPGAGLTAGVEADYPTTKIQIRLKSGGATPSFTFQWLGGLRDRDVAGGGFWRPAGTSPGYYATIKTLLTSPSNAWNIYVLNPAILAYNIKAFNAATGVVTTVGSNILDEAKVRIKGVRGIAKANGIWKVTKLGDQSYQLQGWIGTTEIFGKSNASIREQIPIGFPIADMEIVQSTSHKVGKPTGLLGGRRRRRAS